MPQFKYKPQYKNETISKDAYKHKFIENVNLAWNEYPKSLKVDIKTFMSPYTI